MVRKTRFKESVNIMSDEIYDNIAMLGYICSLAANDLHHIHLCAEGYKFQEIHECADNYLSRVRELGDFCLELAKEGGISLYNETYALEVLKDNNGSDWQVADKDSYDFVEAFTTMSGILSDLVQGITLIQEEVGVRSDVISVLDDYSRYFTKEVNYFITKKLEKDNDIIISKKESLHNKFSRNNKRRVRESYRDSDAYKRLADYEYVCEVRGNTVTIKWADDGHIYARFKLISPEETFKDTDINPYDDFGKSHGFDTWLMDDGNSLIDTDATTYDRAVEAAIKYFWHYY